MLVKQPTAVTIRVDTSVGIPRLVVSMAPVKKTLKEESNGIFGEMRKVFWHVLLAVDDGRHRLGFSYVFFYIYKTVDRLAIVYDLLQN